MQTIKLKPGAYRQHLLMKLQRDWPAVRILRNGRKLNRLSLKQLEAKWRAFERMQSTRREKYVVGLDALHAAYGNY